MPTKSAFLWYKTPNFGLPFHRIPFLRAPCWNGFQSGSNLLSNSRPFSSSLFSWTEMKSSKRVKVDKHVESEEKKEETPSKKVEEEQTGIENSREGKPEAEKKKEELERKKATSVAVYTEFIKGSVLSGDILEAYLILLKMPELELIAKTSTYNLVLSALLHGEKYPELEEVYASMKKYSIPRNKSTLSILFDCFKKTKSQMLEADLEPFLKRRDAQGEALERELRPIKKFRDPFKQPEGPIATHDKKLSPISLESEDAGFIDEFDDDEFLSFATLDRDYRVALSKQFRLETRVVSESIERYKSTLKSLVLINKGASLSPAQRVLLSWFQPLVVAISEFQRTCAPVVDSRKSRPEDFLRLLDAERLAVLTMHEVLSHLLAKPAGTTFSKLSVELGKAVQAEVNFGRMKDSKANLLKKLREEGTLWSVHNINKRAKGFLDDSDWPVATLARVGGHLIELLMKTADVPQDPLSKSEMAELAGERRPAFVHGYLYEGKKKIGMVKLDEDVLKTIDDAHVKQEIVHARHLPMLVPPRPWVSSRKGGYLTITSSIMRYKGSHLQMELLKSANDLSQIYDSLNILGSTPWRINQGVYKVVNEAWKGGGGIADLPTHSNIPLPRPPEIDIFANKPKERFKWKSHQKKTKQLNWDRHGLRCETNYKLAVAHEFQSVPFYLPHNVDFRGRAYPIPPHLNQMGSDLCRGLMLFDEGRPLGERGLRWLKVHLSNLCGNNKISFDDRVKFVEENIERVLDSANRPLDGSRWWLTAEDPWQALATCFEIRNALESGKPEEYVCHLPVHQDGSCNGLQHYAALGGDILGAQQVNLLPAEKPQDVYSGVAAMVAEKVHADALSGHELAQKLDGQIVRKIVKQTVMTSVYGVTLPGARKQILNAMKAVKVKNFEMADDNELFSASFYLTKLTFEALSEMFLGARKIMSWLAECAKLIALTQKPVTWLTPLGLPVIQPYRKMGKKAVKTVVQTIILESDNDQLPVSVARQKSAFPPNYVHSLDSTHMMLTAMAVQREGITFSSVHDSYWCHPSNVDQMGKILRQEFIRLHQQPLLHQLRDSFVRNYPTIEFPPVPQKGDLDLEEVANSTYFFH